MLAHVNAPRICLSFVHTFVPRNAHTINDIATKVITTKWSPNEWGAYAEGSPRTSIGANWMVSVPAVVGKASITTGTHWLSNHGEHVNRFQTYSDLVEQYRPCSFHSIDHHGRTDRQTITAPHSKRTTASTWGSNLVHKCFQNLKFANLCGRVWIMQ